MTRYTPGPWTVAPPHMGFSKITGRDGQLIFGLAAGGDAEKRPDDECEANADLIAAAPDLLAALEAVVTALDGRVHSHAALAALSEARAAIAKAKGE